MSLLRALFFILIVTIFFSSCTGDTTTRQPVAESTVDPNLQSAGKLIDNKLPSIEQKEMQNIWNTCTNVDFVFYDYSFSMNQTEDASIKNTLTYVSTTVPPKLDTGCKPIGRIFYVANGEGLAEAEFFLGNVCNYFIFYKDGKQVAANMMTPKGEEFLKGTILKVTKGMPK